MMHSKLNHQSIIFLSIILFLSFKQTISKHELVTDQLVTDSGLISQESKAEEMPIKKKKTPKEGKSAYGSINSLLHLSNVIEQNPTIPPEIEEGCKKGDYPRACEVAALSFDNDKIDASSLYYSSTKALQQALETAKASLEEHQMAGVDEKVGSVCEQVYGDALKALRKALKASAERDRYLVFLHYSAVITNIETCQESVPHKSKSKLEQVNMVLWRLSANSLSLAAEAIK